MCPRIDGSRNRASSRREQSTESKRPTARPEAREPAGANPGPAAKRGSGIGS